MGTKVTKRLNPHKVNLLDPIDDDSDGDWGLSQDTKFQIIKSNRQLSKQRSKKRKSWSLTLKKKNVYSVKLFNELPA